MASDFLTATQKAKDNEQCLQTSGEKRIPAKSYIQMNCHQM